MQACCHLSKQPMSCKALHASCNACSQAARWQRAAVTRRIADGRSTGATSCPRTRPAVPECEVISRPVTRPAMPRVGVSDPARGRAQLEGRDRRAQARRGGRPARVGRRAAGEVQLPGSHRGGRHYVQAIGQAELVPAARRGRAERANARAAHGDAGLEEALRARMRGGCSAPRSLPPAGSHGSRCRSVDSACRMGLEPALTHPVLGASSIEAC